MKLKRFLTASVSYFMTGVGGYYPFSGGANFYSIMIIMAGLIGILVDIFKIKKAMVPFIRIRAIAFLLY